MSYIASASGDALYLRWQKGMAWWVIILGIVLSIVLPPLLGAAIYAILPDWMKDLTNAIIVISVMGIMVYFMSKMSGVFK
jgi:predicted Na+-dependent transporter